MRTKRRITVLAVLLAVAIVLLTVPLVLNPYLLSVLILIFISILPTISTRVSLIVGQINIAVIGFFAIGGYTSGYLTMNLGVPFLAAFLAGGIVAAIVSLLLGAIIINLGDLYFIIITWGFLEVVRSVAVKATPLTGGAGGLIGIPPISLGGITFSKTAEYFFILLAVSLILYALYRIEYSRLGLTWKSIGQAPSLSEAVGISAYKYKIISFVISSFIAGLGGALYAHHMGVLQPVTFTFMLATTVIIYNFFGGNRHFIGPIVGAFVLLLAVEPLRGLHSYEMMAYAGVIILVIIFLPDGLISLPDRLAPLTRRLFRSDKGVPERNRP